MTRSPKKAPILIITPGDPAGIGAEITWKLIQGGWARKLGVRFLCAGAAAPFTKLKAPIRDFTEGDLGNACCGSSSKEVWLLRAPSTAPKRGLHLGGYQSGWAIENATHLVLAGDASALVTGPISKEHLQAGGYDYPGHTEFLADLCDAGSVTMMLANEELRVSMVTTHIALREVPEALTSERLERAVRHTVTHLQNWWGIARPRVAIAALNPHAGEGGILGRDERDRIEPWLGKIRRKFPRAELLGPLPADTLFANHILAVRSRGAARKNAYDAVICMYHDQGLIPVKLLDFQRTVNVTLGLPIVRTSVDHGTAFDIAGRGIADPSSLISAAQLAAKIVHQGSKLR